MALPGTRLGEKWPAEEGGARRTNGGATSSACPANSTGENSRYQALIGSGLCNMSDVLSSIVVIIGVKFSKKPADHRYPYGYGKIEFIAQDS